MKVQSTFYIDFISKTVDVLLISSFITKQMPKLLIFDAFMLLICKKNVAIYVLLRCKIFSLKIWLCKFFDKFLVWPFANRGRLGWLSSSWPCTSTGCCWVWRRYQFQNDLSETRFEFPRGVDVVQQLQWGASLVTCWRYRTWKGWPSVVCSWRYI